MRTAISFMGVKRREYKSHHGSSKSGVYEGELLVNVSFLGKSSLRTLHVNIGFPMTGGYLMVSTPRLRRVEAAVGFDVAIEATSVLLDITAARDTNMEDFILTSDGGKVLSEVKPAEAPPYILGGGGQQYCSVVHHSPKYC